MKYASESKEAVNFVDFHGLESMGTLLQFIEDYLRERLAIPIEFTGVELIHGDALTNVGIRFDISLTQDRVVRDA